MAQLVEHRAVMREVVHEVELSMRPHNRKQTVVKLKESRTVSAETDKAGRTYRIVLTYGKTCESAAVRLPNTPTSTYGEIRFE